MCINRNKRHKCLETKFLIFLHPNLVLCTDAHSCEWCLRLSSCTWKNPTKLSLIESSLPTFSSTIIILSNTKTWFILCVSQMHVLTWSPQPPSFTITSCGLAQTSAHHFTMKALQRIPDENAFQNRKLKNWHQSVHSDLLYSKIKQYKKFFNKISPVPYSLGS